MKRTFACVAGFLLCLPFFAQTKINVSDDVTFWSDLPDEVLADEIASRMTDTELLSQILMFGWAGAEPEKLLFDWVDRGLGSVKVFGWNTDDINLVAKSITRLQKKSAEGRFKIPLFVATDQEGGWIRHVKGETAITPGNMAIGSGGYPADAWYSAFYISREIKILGINMNFAPTVDLFTNHDSTIIGTRSFGDEPEKAGILGGAWASGSIAAGIIPTVKHFPGHGDTSYDSHIHLPEINVDFDTFTKRELVPFMYLIKQGVPAVMSGHLSFPKIDPTGTPASLSKYFLTDLLRGQLGYKGLIITDDMTMNGATTFAGSLSAAFRMAIEAGNDIIISSKTAKLGEALWTSNLSRMSYDQDFKKRVYDSARRVIIAKLKYFKSGNAAPLYPEASQIPKHIPDRDGQKFFLEQACRSIAVARQSLIPADDAKAGKVLLVGSLPSFFEEGKKRFAETGDFKFSYEIGPNETQWVCDNIGKIVPAYDTIIVMVYSERTARIAEWLKQYGKKTVVFSIMTPTNALHLDWADDIIVGYSYSDFTIKAMFGALTGEYKAEGKLPFTE